MIDNLILTHGIKRMPFHFLTENETIYQVSHCPRKRTLPEHEIKPVLNGRCRGFMIYGRFISRTALEKKLYPTIRIVNIKAEDGELPF